MDVFRAFRVSQGHDRDDARDGASRDGHREAYGEEQLRWIIFKTMIWRGRGGGGYLTANRMRWIECVGLNQ